MPILTPCERCETPIKHKPSRTVRFCSKSCKALAERTRPLPDPRPCVVCGLTFKPARHRGDAKYCSKSCILKDRDADWWKTTANIEARRRAADRQRGTGTKGYVKRGGRHEHRVVAEQMLGRALLPGEVVHHIDEDKHNNSPENLMVMRQREHMLLHGLGVPGVSRRKKGEGRAHHV